MKQFILFFIIFFIFFTQISSKDLIIKNVSYLDPDTFLFSEPVSIQIKNGYIHSFVITRIDPKDKIRYVIPSLCDSMVTLGANSLGGNSNIDDIKLSLKSFLAHGFTHIQTFADGPWVMNIQDLIKKGKILGPEISIASKPIIPLSNETENISDKLYFVSKSSEFALEEIKKLIAINENHIHLIYRRSNYKDSNFDSKFLIELEDLTIKLNQKLIVYTYADRFSITDSIIANMHYLNFPIPAEISPYITPDYESALSWSPILTPYYFLSLQSDEKELKEEFQLMKDFSPFFRKNYANKLESVLANKTHSLEDLKQVSIEYKSYIKFLSNNKKLKGKMRLSSHSGSYFVFPGIGGLQELNLIRNVIKDGIDLIKIPTVNTCSFINQEYKGTIRIGNKANLLVLEDNPYIDMDALYHLESVVKNGELLNLK